MHRRNDPLRYLLDGSGTRRATGAPRSGDAETDTGQDGAARRQANRACCRRVTERCEARRRDGQARCIDSKSIVETDEVGNPRRARRRRTNRSSADHSGVTQIGRDSHHRTARTETEPGIQTA